MEDIIGVSIKYKFNNEVVFEDTLEGLSDMFDLDLFSCKTVGEVINSISNSIKNFVEDKVVFNQDLGYAKMITNTLDGGNYCNEYGFIQFYI